MFCLGNDLKNYTTNTDAGNTEDLLKIGCNLVEYNFNLKYLPENFS